MRGISMSFDEELEAIRKILDEVDEQLSIVSKTVEAVEIETKLLGVELENTVNEWGNYEF